MRRFFYPALLILPALLGTGAIAGIPVPRGSRLTEPIDRGISAMETIRIVTRWDTAGYSISPDFSGLDGATGGEVAVFDSLNGSYLLVYTTGAMAGLQDTSGIVIPITAVGGQLSFVDRELKVCRNNLTPIPEHVVSEIASPPNPQLIYHPGDNLIINTHWRIDGVGGFTLAADFRELAPHFRETDARVSFISESGDRVSTYEITYKVPPAADLAPDANNIHLTVVGRDTLCSEILESGITVNLRRGGLPAPKEHRLIDLNDERPASDLRRVRYNGINDSDVGRTIRIFSRWDSSGFSVRADFRSLDGSSVLETARPDTGTGNYIIDHVVQAMGAMPDDSVIIAITAMNRFGDSYTDRTLQICRNRSTPIPTHLGTWIRGDRRKFRSNDSLAVMTAWQSPVALPIEVIPAYQELVPRFQPSDASVLHRGVDTFLVVYRLPVRDPIKDPLVPDGKNIPIVIVARDRLWGMSQPETIRVELDTTPPPSPPTFNLMPAETNLPRVHITGNAVGAARIAIARAELDHGETDLHFRFYATVDTLGNFEADVDLVPDRNKIGGWSEDDIGNRTTIGLSQIVRYVTAQTATYPTPFRPDDEIAIEDQHGMREARVEIYNLEGERIAEMDLKGSLLAARFRWDGKDSHGDRAQPGYYLMHVRRVLLDGKTREEVLPLLFRND